MSNPSPVDLQTSSLPSRDFSSVSPPAPLANGNASAEQPVQSAAPTATEWVQAVTPVVTLLLAWLLSRGNARPTAKS